MISLAMLLMKAIMGFIPPGVRTLKPIKPALPLLVAGWLCLLLPMAIMAASQGNGPDDELFLPSADAMADVNSAMQRAQASHRRVLVIMGANWCHDSRALASRVQQEPLQSVINDHYETVFVDVGYLDQGSEVINAIGPPVYYATPTVLIIDPASGQLVNADNRHQWGNADTISMEESVAYFELMASTDTSAMQGGQVPGEDRSTPELEVLLENIDAFEEVQAQRLYAAYGVIGPMLQAYKEGHAPVEFESTWNEVRDYRMKVPGDIDQLREEALRRTAAGEQNIQLQYPHYASFSWEAAGGGSDNEGSE